MYIKLTNGIPEKYSIGMLRRDNPNISFPKNPNQSVLASFDVYPCVEDSVPVYDGSTHSVVDDGFEFVNGQWVALKTVVQRPLEEAQENIRDKRNSLLKSCDWTQVADAPVNSLAWANYRQSLRDVTDQVGFPYDVTWPTQPE